MRSGTGRILLLAAILGMAICAARPADAALVTLVEDNGNDVDLPGNVQDRVTADPEWVNLDQVVFSIELQTRDDQGVLGLSSINLNDTNEAWFNFTLELVGATWAMPTLANFAALDDEGLFRGGLSLTVNAESTLLTMGFDPELSDRSTFTVGNVSTAIFDLLNDLLIDISALETGESFGLILQPNRTTGPDDGGGISIPAPPALAMGLVCMGVGAGLRKRRLA